MTQENKNPFDLVDKENQETITSKVNEKSWQFFENLIKKLAKMLWMPDPKTWAKNANTSTDDSTKENATNKDTTLEQDVSPQDTEKKQEKFSFDNIMSGVSDVLGKIGETVKEKTWINLTSPLKKNDENLDNKPEKDGEQSIKEDETTTEKAA